MKGLYGRASDNPSNYNKQVIAHRKGKMESTSSYLTDDDEKQFVYDELGTPQMQQEFY